MERDDRPLVGVRRQNLSHPLGLYFLLFFRVESRHVLRMRRIAGPGEDNAIGQHRGPVLLVFGELWRSFVAFMSEESDQWGSKHFAKHHGREYAFAIAGEDGKWHWADSEIKGDTVVVSSQEVPQPVAVRYAWAMNPSERNLLYNKEGLPASPFRTDAWPLF